MADQDWRGQAIGDAVPPEPAADPAPDPAPDTPPPLPAASLPDAPAAAPSAPAPPPGPGQYAQQYAPYQPAPYQPSGPPPAGRTAPPSGPPSGQAGAPAGPLTGTHPAPQAGPPGYPGPHAGPPPASYPGASAGPAGYPGYPNAGPQPGPAPGGYPGPQPGYPPAGGGAPPLEAATPPVPDRPVGARQDEDASVAGRIRHGDSVGKRAFGAVRGLVGSGPDRALASAVGGVQTPVSSGRRIAVVSARGGSGKSTVAALLGIVYGLRRSDRVLALDAELGLGSLAHRLGMPVGRTLAHVGPYVLTGALTSGTQIEQAIPRHPTGLWVLPGPPPELAAGIPATGPVDTAKALSQHFGVTILDCAAGIGGDTNAAVLADAHAIVFVTHASVEGVRSAEAGLRLLATTVPDFAAHAVAVLVSMNPRTEGLDLTRAQAVLRPLCSDVVRLPYDRHLAAGGSLHVDQLGATTTVVATALAASALRLAIGDMPPPPAPDPYDPYQQYAPQHYDPAQHYSQPYDPAQRYDAPPYGPPQSYDLPQPYHPGQPTGMYEAPQPPDPGPSEDPFGPPQPYQPPGNSGR
jgi:MinD-like ATPase involved in chromosome partitioning or flagellar assembly